MWVNKQFFEMVIADNKAQQDEIAELKAEVAARRTAIAGHNAQKAKDDMSIDWLRHRVNALEKQNAILLQKAAGVAMPVPEIVPTRPGTIAGSGIDFDHMPSFEDVGDAEAARLGIEHDDAGHVQFKE